MKIIIHNLTLHVFRVATLFFIVLLFSNCAFLDHDNYMTPNITLKNVTTHDCVPYAKQIGPRRGININNKSINIFICSRAHRSSMISFGLFLPILPLFAGPGYVDEYRWIKVHWKSCEDCSIKTDAPIPFVIQRVNTKDENEHICCCGRSSSRY